jgi:hypothetical protein
MPTIIDLVGMGSTLGLPSIWTPANDAIGPHMRMVKTGIITS